jgi:hypothetical protein
MNIEVPEMLRTGPIAHNRYGLSDEQFGLTNQDPLNVETILQFLRRSWRQCSCPVPTTPHTLPFFWKIEP